MIKPLIDIAVPIINFVLLIGIGMELTGADFTRLRQHRALVLSGLFAPLVLLPPLAVALTSIFRTGPEITAGLLLIAACPIGGISNAYTYLARASTALSVTLTGLSCLFAGVTIPLVTQGLEWAVGRRLDFSAPVPLLFAQTLLMLALPVVIGMTIRRRRPDVATRHRAALQRLAFVSIAVVMALVVADAPGTFARDMVTTAAPATVFLLTSMLLGWLTASPFSRDIRDRFAVATEFGTRNIGVALAIAVTLLGRVEFGRFAIVYAFVEVPLMVVIVALFRHYQARVPSVSAALRDFREAPK